MKYDTRKTFEDNAEAIGVIIIESFGTWLVTAGTGAQLYTDKQKMVDTIMGFFDVD